MTFPNPPTFSTKRTHFHPPCFAPCHNPPRSAFGYTGDCEPGEAEPAPEGAAVAGQTLRAGCNGLPLVEGKEDGEDPGWVTVLSTSLQPSDVPQRHTNKAPDPVTGLVTKTAGAVVVNDPLPGRGSGRDVRTSAENLKPPGHPARTSRRDVPDPSPVDDGTSVSPARAALPERRM
ncbi:hypothetical protein PDO_5019, partial [Rhizobium sp. PDO1-076]